jgi:hypothetical protein
MINVVSVLRYAAACAVVASLCSVPAAAQMDMGAIFGGRMPPTRYRIGFSYEEHGDAEFESATADVSLIRLGLDVSATLAKTESSKLELSVRGHQLALDNDAMLPLSASPVPDELTGTDLALGWSTKLVSGRSVSLRLGAGSSSDEPFEESDVSKYSLMFFTMDDAADGRAWMFFLIGGSYMAELNYIPIPGFAYLKTSESYSVIAGIPFVMGSWRGEKWSLTGSYFPVTNLNLSAAYRIFGPFRLKFGLSRKHANYLLYDLPEDEEQFAFYETRAYMAFTGFLARSLSFELQAGYAFNRAAYQGEGFYVEGYENEGDALDMGDAAYISFKLRYMAW